MLGHVDASRGPQVCLKLTRHQVFVALDVGVQGRELCGCQVELPLDFLYTAKKEKRQASQQSERNQNECRLLSVTCKGTTRT